MGKSLKTLPFPLSFHYQREQISLLPESRYFCSGGQSQIKDLLSNLSHQLAEWDQHSKGRQVLSTKKTVCGHNL